MNKYLVKIAEQTYHPVGAAVAGVGVGVAGRIASGYANRPISNVIHQNPSTNWKTMKKILRDSKDINVTFSSTKAMHGMTQGRYNHEMQKAQKMGPFYENSHSLKSKGAIGKKDFINMSYEGSHTKRIKNLDVAIHELGHAKDRSNSGGYSSARRGLSGALRKAKKYHLGTIGGAAMLAHDDTKGKAWVAPLVVNAPTLRAEAAANYHGYKMLSKHGTPAMRKSFRGLIGKNMLGYAGKPAAQAALLYALGRAEKKNDDK